MSTSMRSMRMIVRTRTRRRRRGMTTTRRRMRRTQEGCEEDGELPKQCLHQGALTYCAEAFLIVPQPELALAHCVGACPKTETPRTEDPQDKDPVPRKKKRNPQDREPHDRAP